MLITSLLGRPGNNLYMQPTEQNIMLKGQFCWAIKISRIQKIINDISNCLSHRLWKPRGDSILRYTEDLRIPSRKTKEEQAGERWPRWRWPFRKSNGSLLAWCYRRRTEWMKLVILDL